VIPPSLFESVDHYGASIKAWITSLSSAPVAHLALEASRAREALVAINKDRKRSLSQFGLSATSAFSNFSFVTPRRVIPLEP
jgi:hypothetical protein